MRDLAVIIVSYNTVAMLRECLAAVLDKGRASVSEIIVVDNNSVDGSSDMVRREFPTVRLIAQSSNAGFGAANNVGVAASTSRYVMLLNSDAILLEDTGGGLVQYLENHAEVSCVGPRVVLPNGKAQPRVYGHQPSLWRIAMQSLALGALFRRSPWFEGTDGGERPGPEAIVGWISGVCMVMRRADFLAVGGFDTKIFMYCEDVEICARLSEQIGPVVRLNGFAVRHYGGASSPTVPAQIRSAVWVQRNLLNIVRAQSGPRIAAVAKMFMSLGLLLRVGVGLIMVPRKGMTSNLLLRTSWVRMIDLVGRGS